MPTSPTTYPTASCNHTVSTNRTPETVLVPRFTLRDNITYAPAK
jgi:hypothetical protein